MRFSNPLAVGQAGLDEVMDLEIVAPCDGEQLRQQLNQSSVPGLKFKAVEMLSDSVEKLKAKSFWYEVPVDPELHDRVKNKMVRFLASDSYPLKKTGQPQTIDIRPLVLDLRLDEGCLQMHLAATQQAGIRPMELLELLGLSATSLQGATLRRTAVQL